MNSQDTFGARATLHTAGGAIGMYRLDAIEKAGVADLSRMPFSIKVLLETVLRNQGEIVSEGHVKLIAGWKPNDDAQWLSEFPYLPARVILQDFTGVPCVVDLAAMRSALARMGKDPRKINPLVPVDLVIDHSIQVDEYGTADALQKNVDIEFERNIERYQFLKWGQKALSNFRVVPPATGIVHQVNLEYLANVVMTQGGVAMPDSVVGTDSHTTMINGLGVVGWGVGGIEAEAVMLNQPIYMLVPKVVGMRLTGRLREGVTATDLVLTVTQILRKHGVVDKFVEFYGPGISQMSLADRATIANMAPEYGATIGFFPVDDETLRFMRRTGRPESLVDLVERYTKEQGLFRTNSSPDPVFTEYLALDLSDVEPSLAGPKRPQDRVSLANMKSTFTKELANSWKKGGEDDKGVAGIGVEHRGRAGTIQHGSVVIAAITSCTNTSNPSVLIGAGLVAKKAVERGLNTQPWVKTSLAPGSRVVTDYLAGAGLAPYLDQLGFQTVGYGCTTCIGNSGPLPDVIGNAITQTDAVVAAVLSGNRNFEGRIHAQVKANYLASPPLVVAYALAGRVDIDLTTEPLGTGSDGQPVFLKDIWPTQAEIDAAVETYVTAEHYRNQYAKVEDGSEQWNKVQGSVGDVYQWDGASTYIQEPPYFVDLPETPSPIQPISHARALAFLGDSVTTDHISPAGNIKKDSPAGRYLVGNGVTPADFNSYGARRGNDRVMTRGTFANVRIRNLLAPGTEGGVTTFLGQGENNGKVMAIYDAAEKYRAEGQALCVLAGKDYGMGSSRDWAAKGTMLLGVKFVLAETYERIHRSNLVGMGVLPLQFKTGENAQTYGLSGHEIFSIEGLSDQVTPKELLTVVARSADGSEKRMEVICRLDTPVDVVYYRNGGILQTVLRKLAK